ncbi:MAG: indolepyruvate oxidoreductase subunit beta [Thermoplasmata archaeon]
MNSSNVKIVGVGGQGVVSAGIILGEAASKRNVNVVMSEIHGMAQRGGIVSVDIRFGDVYGPISPDNNIDLLIGFEILETIRAFKYTNDKTFILMNNEKIIPFTSNLLKIGYPNVENYTKDRKGRFLVIDAVEIANRVGTYKAVNTVMIGAATALGILPVNNEDVEEAIKGILPKSFWDINIKAFRMGIEATNALRAAYL